MSRFGTTFGQVATPRLLDTFGEPIVLTPAEGAAVELNAIVGPSRKEEQSENVGRGSRTIRTVTIGTADCPRPTLNATLTIAGEIWSVTRVQELSGGRARLECVRTGVVERSRADYRG
jgi:hypothetical protein